MMHLEKFVCAIKTDGKVLREFKDTVYIPFSSEYQIFLKNLNSVRALVDISIDGRKATGNGGLVLSPNTEFTLDRFIDNIREGNRFKFCERTEAIENHRGVKAEDGLIRISFRYERVPHFVPPPIYNSPYYGQPIDKSPLRGISGAIGASGFLGNVSAQNVGKSFSANETGITVEGSKSNQQFSTCGWFPTETQEHVMVIKLLGDLGDNKPVAAPVTVKTKPICKTCGTKNKATAKFCSECGTAVGLELVA
jgi:ribosomal protein L40E